MTICQNLSFFGNFKYFFLKNKAQNEKKKKKKKEKKKKTEEKKKKKKKKKATTTKTKKKKKKRRRKKKEEETKNKQTNFQELNRLSYIITKLGTLGPNECYWTLDVVVFAFVLQQWSSA